MIQEHQHTLRSASQSGQVALPEFHETTKINFAGTAHDVRCSRLCPVRAITYGLDGLFLFDCHDLWASPRTYRPHMYNGHPKNVSYEEKLARMTKWQSALLFFDSRMVDVDSRCSGAEVMSVLRAFQLPRAERVELDTASEGLERLFTRLGYRQGGQPPHPFIVTWRKLIADASAGGIVDEWAKLKGEHKLAAERARSDGKINSGGRPQ